MRLRLPKKLGEVTKVIVVTFSLYAYRWIRLPFQSIMGIMNPTDNSLQKMAPKSFNNIDEFREIPSPPSPRGNSSNSSYDVPSITWCYITYHKPKVKGAINKFEYELRA